jgi:hypothetical protein
MSYFLRLAVISVLLAGSLSAAPKPWTQIKVGMSTEEIITLLGLLGDPVSRRQGRGFETWTYDHGAEVLIYKLVVGWTAPTSATLVVRSEDVWSNHPQGDYFSPVRAVLRKNAAKLAPATAAKRPLSTTGMGYEEYLQTYGRSKV